ncbi:MAG: DUF126 domain-containing protein [Alphaproteobacteria bacterium]|nr:DUF126 domain-containing protein [Alphaproteobacteria bacterium]
MISLAANIIVDGTCDAPALVTRQPINFTAALCKFPNLLPSKRGESHDQHHELFGQRIDGTVLVFPTCVGSTYTGLVLLELVSSGRGPAALVVQKPDPLLVSGVILSEVWYAKCIPVLAYPDEDLFSAIRTGDRVCIEQGTGKIGVERPTSPVHGSVG